MEMRRSRFQQRLERVCRGKVLCAEPLSKHTSFGIGGPADFFVYPSDPDNLQRVLSLAREEGVSVFVIGGGTNLLVRDGGLRGMVVKLTEAFSKIEVRDCCVSVGAGAGLPRLIQFCAASGLGGLEFAAGIPGTVGGAIKGNVGTTQGEISDRAVRVEGIDMASGDALGFKKDQIGFTYRKTNLPSNLLLTKADLQLYHQDPETIALKIGNHFKARSASQPIGEKCAGCIFKNPRRCPAGELIDQAGCKGMSQGDAAVSGLHANFIINRGKAKASDVVKLIEKVRNQVRKTTGIELELEVEIVGV